MYLLPNWWLITFLLCAIVLVLPKKGIRMSASTSKADGDTRVFPVQSDPPRIKPPPNPELGVYQTSVGKAERNVGDNLEWKKFMSRTLR